MADNQFDSQQATRSSISMKKGYLNKLLHMHMSFPPDIGAHRLLFFLFYGCIE